MEHTPGPLNIVKRDVDLNGYLIHSSIEAGSPEGPRVIALVMDCAEAEANARLIKGSFGVDTSNIEQLHCADPDCDGVLTRSANANWNPATRDWDCVPDLESTIECLECGGGYMVVKNAVR